MTFIPHFLRAASVAALLTSFSPVLLADAPSVPLPVGREVVLTGWLHVQDYSFALTTVEAQVNGTVQYASVSRTGRFSLTLPADAEALIRFEHPGHVAKEIVVDTHFAGDGEVGQHDRQISFAVVLEPERHMAGFAYAGPVARIAFDQGGGCALVEKDRKLMSVRRGKAIEF